jgi:[FeFe] hydrogenase H-cluster maturation GTPase HydF
LRKVPALVVFNKKDLGEPGPEDLRRLSAVNVRYVVVSSATGAGIDDLREAILDISPAQFFESRHLISDLVAPGEIAVLVIPIDKEAPKGRIILPQVMAIRDLLDGGSMAVVAQAHELPRALEALSRRPALVVTDSQAFAEVAEAVPPDVPMTSFSILLARFQGDLAEQVRGTLGIERLREGDRVLVAETCTHHPIGDDIGRVKIPRWLRSYSGAELEFEHVQGRDFPATSGLRRYALIVHCGNCTGNRREMISRIRRARAAGVPITNYGLAIAYSLGIFERALVPFPDALEAYRGARV